MPDFTNLPAILRWEISLALLVLAWSLLSLGRYERLKRRWRRRRSTAPARAIHPWGELHPSGRSRGRRPQRLRVIAAAAGFASVAASVAYAMPNIVHLDHPGSPRPTARGPEPHERRSPRPRQTVLERVTPQPRPAIEEEEAELPRPRPPVGADVTVTVQTEMVTSAATGTSYPPATPEASSSSSPGAVVDPTPTPEVTPSPTPTPSEDVATPLPEPTQ